MFFFLVFFCCKAGFVCTLICLSLLCLSPDMDSLARPRLARLHSSFWSAADAGAANTNSRPSARFSLYLVFTSGSLFRRQAITVPSCYLACHWWRVIIAASTRGCSTGSCISYDGRSNFGWLRCRFDSIFESVWLHKSFFRHSLNGVKKCIVTHPKVK